VIITDVPESLHTASLVLFATERSCVRGFARKSKISSAQAIRLIQLRKVSSVLQYLGARIRHQFGHFLCYFREQATPAAMIEPAASVAGRGPQRAAGAQPLHHTPHGVYHYFVKVGVLVSSTGK
jgi:hypothetical protein